MRSALILRGDELVLSPQVYYEFWVVATRSQQANGLALSVQETEREIAKFQQVFALLEDPPTIFGQWLNLVRTYAITGKRAHDTRNCVRSVTFSLSTHKTFKAMLGSQCLLLQMCSLPLRLLN